MHRNTSKHVLIVGCGYVGMALGRHLASEGHVVFGLRRSQAGHEAMETAGIRPVVGDITRADDLRQLPGPFHWVVNLVSSSRGGTTEYRDVYVGGMRHLMNAVGGDVLEKFVYTSSTSVYSQSDGSTVDENSPVVAQSETSQSLIDAEMQLLQGVPESRFPAVILRASGIYGPERGHLFRQFIAGEARRIGDSSRWLNMIHRDDLVGAIVAALERGVPGERYNATDDCPVTELEFFEWLVRELGMPMPAVGGAEVVSRRKRALTSKRVLNGKLRAIGWHLRYPSFREGYAEDVKRALDRLGSRP